MGKGVCFLVLVVFLYLLGCVSVATGEESELWVVSFSGDLTYFIRSPDCPHCPYDVASYTEPISGSFEVVASGGSVVVWTWISCIGYYCPGGYGTWGLSPGDSISFPYHEYWYPYYGRSLSLLFEGTLISNTSAEGTWTTLGFCYYSNDHVYRIEGTGNWSAEKEMPPPKENESPVASFTYSPEKPMAGGEITFDASFSYDPDGTIVKYEWNFGDGNSAEEVQVTHAYDEADDYIVTLKVTDNDGLKDSVTRKLDLQIGDIKISPTNPETMGKVTFKIEDLPPNAKVSWIISPIEPHKAGNVVIGKGSPFTHTFPPGTHGTKRVEAIVILDSGGIISKTKEFELFFDKKGKDYFGPANWFRYWSTSDDGAASYNRKGWKVLWVGGDYDGEVLGMTRFGLIFLFNRASMDCSYTYAPANIYNNLTGVDCVESIFKHEQEHINIGNYWKSGGKWHNLYGPRTTGVGGNDIDGDRIPNEVEIGIGLNSTTKFTFPYFPISPKGGDEEVYIEYLVQDKHGIHKNDWANPGKQSYPKYRRIITENGTAATFTGNFVDYGSDTDGNGLYNYLVVETEINIMSAGTYTIFGNLYDSNENMLWAENHTYLSTGLQSVSLNFDGLTIYQLKGNESFNLRYLHLFGKNFTDFRNNSYNTSSYSYTEFEKPAVNFVGCSDIGVDINGNGLFEHLKITAIVNASFEGNYSLLGWIDKNITILSAENSTYLDTGTGSIDLYFSGLDIHRNHIDGPYTIELTISDMDGTAIDYFECNTSLYNYTQFEKPLIELTGNFSDYGVDEDSNGLYDYLVIETEVNVSKAGNYSSVVWLYANETAIVKTTSFDYLGEGIRTIDLKFDGLSIGPTPALSPPYEKGIDGPYILTHLTLHDENGSMVKYEWDVYNTSAYNYTEFQGRADGWWYVFPEYVGGCEVFLYGSQDDNIILEYQGGQLWKGTVSCGLETINCDYYFIAKVKQDDGADLRGVVEGDSGPINITVYGEVDFDVLDIWGPGTYEIGYVSLLAHQDKEFLFSAGLEFQTDLDYGIISQGLQEEFEAHGISLEDASVSVESSGTRWKIEPIYSVRKEGGRLNIYKVFSDVELWRVPVWINYQPMTVHPGDVNGDCTVNIFDLAAVGLAFGSQSGDDNWNPDADLTGDGLINIFDLATVGLNYGQSC